MRKQTPRRSTLKGTTRAILAEDNFHFNGIGERCAADICHLARIPMSMPMNEVCDSDTLFTRLKDSIESYLLEFTSSEYYKRVAVTADLHRPFEFQYEADRQQVSRYQLVYRKASVKMTVRCWMEMWKEGLFDATHTIGD